MYLFSVSFCHCCFKRVREQVDISLTHSYSISQMRVLLLCAYRMHRTNLTVLSNERNLLKES